MQSGANVDASLYEHIPLRRALAGAGPAISSEDALQRSQQPQQPPDKQSQLRLCPLPSSADPPFQQGALAPCLQSHERISQPRQQQQPGALLTHQSCHQQQQEKQHRGAASRECTMATGTADPATQLLHGIASVAAARPDSAGAAVSGNQQHQQQQPQMLPIKLAPEEQHPVHASLAAPPNLGRPADLGHQQQQQPLHHWQQQDLAASQQIVGLQASHQPQQLQGTPSVATTATNVSAFASAAAEGGSSRDGSSSGGGSNGGCSGGGAGRATVIGRTVTGELPVIPQGFDIAAAAVAAATGDDATLRQLSRQCSADQPATAAPTASNTLGQAGLPAASSMQVHLQEQEQQQQQHIEEEIILRHTRQITCKTYLKRLNVTQYMSDNLLPTMEGSLRVSSQKTAAPGTMHGGRGLGQRQHSRARSSTAAASDDEYDPHSKASGAAAGAHGSAAAAGPGSGQRSYEMLFKVQVKLVDSAGTVWPVTYEGVLCAGQRHLRLTCGWSEFIKAKKVAIGDAITFEHRNGNKTALAVAIQKAGQEVEQTWQGDLPNDGIKVLIGSLRSESAGASAAGRARQGSAAALALIPAAAAAGRAAARGSSPVQAPKSGQQPQPLVQQQPLLRVDSAGRRGGSSKGRPAAKRVASRRVKKRGRQRDDSDDEEDWDDREYNPSYDDASSGSTAVTDGGGPGASSSSGKASAGAAARTASGFGPAVKGLEALRVDSGRSGSSIAAAAAAAISAVDAAAAAQAPSGQPSTAAGRSGSRTMPGASSVESPWQQQQCAPESGWSSRPASSDVAVAAAAANPLHSSSRPHHNALAGYPPASTASPQNQYHRRLRQRQQDHRTDDMQVCSTGPTATAHLAGPISSGGSDNSSGQGSGSRDYNDLPAAALNPSRTLSEWAAANILAATESVHSHQPQQQYTQQQQQSHQAYASQQQFLGSSGSAPVPSSTGYSQQPVAGSGYSQQWGAGLAPPGLNPRYHGWQVSTGFVRGPGAQGSNPAGGRFNDVYSPHQQIRVLELQPAPSVGPRVGLYGAAASAQGPRPMDIASGAEAMLSQQRSVLSQQASVLSHQQSVVGQASSSLQAHSSGMYQQPWGLQPQQSVADRAAAAAAVAAGTPRGALMGPPRPVLTASQQQQLLQEHEVSQQQYGGGSGLYLYPPATHQLQQQQQQRMMADERPSWHTLALYEHQKQLHRQQQTMHPLTKLEEALHPDCAWDPQLLRGAPAAQQQQGMLQPQAALQQQQHHSLSPYEQIQLQQLQQQQQEAVAGYRPAHSRREDPSTYDQVQQHFTRHQVQLQQLDQQQQQQARSSSQQLQQEVQQQGHQQVEQLQQQEETTPYKEVPPQQQGVSPYEQVQQQQQPLQDVSPYEQVQQQQIAAADWAVDDMAAPAAADGQQDAQPLQLQLSEGLLQSAAMSADFGSIGAMESVELVDTLLQLLGNEQAAEQQQQLQPQPQQEPLQQGSVAAPAPLAHQQQVLASDNPACAGAADGGHPQHEEPVAEPLPQYWSLQLQPRQAQQQSLRPAGSSGSLLQQWRQAQQLHQPAQRPHLAPPKLLPLEALLHQQQ